MSNDAILLIEDDAERTAQMRAVLNFIDDAPVRVCTPAEWSEQIDDQTLKAVVLGSSESLTLLPKIDAHLQQESRKLPLFLLGDGEAQAERVLGRIPYPPNYNTLITALHRANAYRDSRHRMNGSAAELARVLVGRSIGIHQVRRLIEQVADTDANVLVLGESGTGKEVVAKSLHYLSSRRDMPFVPVNCGAIPKDLLESELFGHEKGAFTGALTTRKGRFEIAEGGTLFLDEIGDMPMPMQVKLLRVLQERTYERVGSNKSITTNVRIIAATHRNLEENIADGSFREDLFYRLNVFPIEMPSLRERPEDIASLANELIRRLGEMGRGSFQLTDAAYTSLSRYPWPGNVRELANLMERLTIIFNGGIVDYDDLPERYQMEGVSADQSFAMPEPEENPFPCIPTSLLPQGEPTQLPADGLDVKEHLAGLEMGYIQQAMDAADGVVAHAAKLLGMRRTTLVEKMRKYGMQRVE
ncbi:MAG: sigma-54 dependent transcriptional regulator [Chromatiales bacterium]|nr:sigma-54 dependent transcriptional regulator [Chromatiales bacterium]